MTETDKRIRNKLYRLVDEEWGVSPDLIHERRSLERAKAKSDKLRKHGFSVCIQKEPFARFPMKHPTSVFKIYIRKNNTTLDDASFEARGILGIRL